MWIIDFEASGLHRFSYPIEVGLTNGELEYQALIKPMDHWQFWSDDSQCIHGISRQDLMGNGQNSAVVANELNQLLAGQNTYCDSIAWDSFWSRVLFSDNGIHQRFEIGDLQHLLTDEVLINAFLEETQRLTASGKYRPHRALDDARKMRAALRFAIGF